MHKEIRAFNVKYQSFILSQCKFAHKYNVAASLYIVAAMMMTSALFLGQNLDNWVERFSKSAYRCN